MNNISANDVYLLAIETSGRTFSLALFKNGSLAGSYFADDGHSHSKRIVSGIKDFLKSSSAGLAQLKYLAVDVGPGSFTGVRVGVSAARMFAQGLGAKLYGVSSLEVCARAFDFFKGLVIAVIPAVKGEIFAAAFDNTGLKMKRVTKEAFLKAEKFEDFIRPLLAKKTGNILLCGSAVSLYGQIFGRALPAKSIIVKSEPLAEKAASRAWERAVKNKPADGRWSDVFPNYVKPPYALERGKPKKTK